MLATRLGTLPKLFHTYRSNFKVEMNICPRLLKAIPTGLLASGKEEPMGMASLTVTELTFLFGTVLGKIYNPYLPFDALASKSQRLPFPSKAISPLLYGATIEVVIS